MQHLGCKRGVLWEICKWKIYYTRQFRQKIGRKLQCLTVEEYVKVNQIIARFETSVKY